MRWTASLAVAAVLALLAALVAIAVLPDVRERPAAPVELSYPALQAQIADGNVASVSVRGEEVSGRLREPVGDEDATEFTSVRPSVAQDDLIAALDERGVPWTAEPAGGGGDGGGLSTFAAWLIPMLVVGGLLLLILRGTAGPRGASSFGRARTRRYEPSQERTTFADVAGIDDAAAELQEVVRFLRDPEPYRRLGAAMPRGVLLFGPPGTGKTLIARAVAGEAGVPFFSLSASEFVEMFVGVGASRVRDLFAKAKEAAPSIVFIDELDAIGRVRSRGAALTSNDEREQTLNQILAELDGFTGAEGVVVIAATNRPEILDPALLRAGRFDRRVSVNPPDRPGREAILRVHTRDVPLADDVDLTAVAAATPGMVGADLRTLVNEGALMAAARGHERVTRADLSDALEKVLLGAERRVVITAEERVRTAYHEAGHALVASLVPGADAVRKVSIVPHGRALGVTLQSPREERHGYTAGELRGRIVAILGGRAAESLVLQEPTTGGEDDLLQATALARRMVGRWGMSQVLGPVSVTPDESLAEAAGAGHASEETRRLVDREVRQLVDSCEREALALLDGHREALERLAAALLARETLEEEDIAAVLAGAPPRADAPLPEAAAH